MVLKYQEPVPAITGLFGFTITLLVLQFGFVGYCFTECTWLERLLFILIAALLIMFVLLKSIVLFIVGASMASLLVLEQWRRKISQKVIQG
jgi:TRAP-type uncharacterized transport system fused permease subunit